MKTKMSCVVGWMALVALAGAGAASCGDLPEDTESVVSALVGPGECSSTTSEQACVCIQDTWRDCITFGPTNSSFGNLENVYFGRFGDSITSYFVGEGAKLKVCSDDSFRGACDLYLGPMSVAKQTTRFPFSTPVPNDSISSLAVYPLGNDCQNPPSHAVAVFKDPNFTGQCTVLRAGNYLAAGFNPQGDGNGGSFGLPDNSISSVKVGPGASVRLFQDTNLNGGSVLLTASASTLNNLTVGGIFIFNFNDVPSSLSVW